MHIDSTFIAWTKTENSPARNAGSSPWSAVRLLQTHSAMKESSSTLRYQVFLRNRLLKKTGIE